MKHAKMFKVLIPICVLLVISLIIIITHNNTIRGTSIDRNIGIENVINTISPYLIKGTIMQNDKEIEIIVDKSETSFLQSHPTCKKERLRVITRFLKVDLADYKIGDEVIISYNGSVRESSPPSITAEGIYSL